MSRATSTAAAEGRRVAVARWLADHIAIEPERAASVAVGATLALAAATGLVAVLEYGLEVVDASSVYLLAVVVVAVFFGVVPAVATAIAGFVLHDFLFIEPRYTLVVNDPRELVTLLLLLVVGLVVGRLAGRVSAIAQSPPKRREREARTMFNVSFTLASQRDTTNALPSIATLLRDEIRAGRVWVVVGDAVAADTLGARAVAVEPPSSTRCYAVGQATTLPSGSGVHAPTRSREVRRRTPRNSPTA